MSNEIGRTKAKVFVLDDHALVREHLTALIQAEHDLTVCGEAEDVPTALALIQQQEPDLVILDISLKRSCGLDLLVELKELRQKPAVLVLSMHDEALYIERALRAGASGYITKAEAPVSIVSAIRQVLSGQICVSNRMGGQARERFISPRQVIAKAVSV
jgi:DNA-binding NarL/FixJ family response regulator